MHTSSQKLLSSESKQSAATSILDSSYAVFSSVRCRGVSMVERATTVGDFWLKYIYFCVLL